MVKIVLTSAQAADSLYEYLERCGCIVARIDKRTVDASAPPRSLNVDLARLELEAYLRVWRELNPNAELAAAPPAEESATR